MLRLDFSPQICSKFFLRVIVAEIACGEESVAVQWGPRMLSPLTLDVKSIAAGSRHTLLLAGALIIIAK